MRYVTSGYLHRLFVEKDKDTILRRPNIRRFVLQYGVPCEQHEKAWLIDFDAFMAAIALREYPPQRGIIERVQQKAQEASHGRRCRGLYF